MALRNSFVLESPAQVGCLLKLAIAQTKSTSGSLILLPLPAALLRGTASAWKLPAAPFLYTTAIPEARYRHAARHRGTGDARLKSSITMTGIVRPCISLIQTPHRF